MRIPEDIVTRLNELSIESVAEKLGIDVKRHKALCFMHDDHTPSLKFTPRRICTTALSVIKVAALFSL